MHRNTLVYRLEKIKKLTGLDLRKFDDAIVFKVALMVKKYLSSDPCPLLKYPISAFSAPPCLVGAFFVAGLLEEKMSR